MTNLEDSGPRVKLFSALAMETFVMPIRFSIAVFMLLGALCLTNHSSADEPGSPTKPADAAHEKTAPKAIPITPELVQAHHAYQLAQLRWQQYRFVELPQHQRSLDNQVRLLTAEIRVLRRRVRDYRPFLQVGRYSPVKNAAENAKLALQAAEQDLQQLKNEQNDTMRFSRQHAQLYQLEVLRAAARVRQVVAKSCPSQEQPAVEILANH